MSSVLKYFKKKIQPLKRCVAQNHSPVINFQEDSFEKKPEHEIDCKTITKKSHNKRKFTLKLKRSIKSNLDDFLKESKAQTDKECEKPNDCLINQNTVGVNQNINIWKNEDQNKFQNHLNPDTISFDSPLSSNDNQSSEMYSSFCKGNTKTIDYGESNFGISSVEGDFFNSHIDRNRASSSSYDPECFIYESVSNSSPANNSSTSMVTYNTKYANSINNDDGLMSSSDSLIRQPSINLSNSIQQSTPYCESLVRVRNLNLNEKKTLIKKSRTANFGSITRITENDGNYKNENQTHKDNSFARKCRRSNTTYTLATTKSSGIIEYFNNIELSKPLKRKANSRLISRQPSNSDIANLSDSSKKLKSDEFYNIYNDIEKLQDAFFSDSSINGKTDDKDNSSLMNNSINKNSVLSNFLQTNTPPTSSAESSDLSRNDEKFDSSNFSKQSLDFKPKKQNDTISINNNSVEKVRRTLSLPGLVHHNSIVLANVSKISSIKDPESEVQTSSLNNKEPSVKVEDSGSNQNITETLVNHSNKDSTHSSAALDGFVRGEPCRRSSKNIKLMFKNVIKQQMNALSNLEKFYEAQVIRIEEDRERNLKLNPNIAERINQYYDLQLKMLEDRVQSNLKFLSENKGSKISTAQPAAVTDDQNKQAKKVLTHKLSQLMLLKQLQQSQQINITQARSKALVDLKASLLNKNNLLPSKIQISNHQSIKQLEENKNFIDLNDTHLKETLFKRHLSLPFKQCKNNPLPNQIQGRIARSPRMSSLAYCSSRSRYNRSNINATSSPLASVQNDLDPSPQLQAKSQLNTQFQFQKNMAKKFSTSTENISQLRNQQANENLQDSGSLLKSFSNNNESTINKVETSAVLFTSKYAQIKRQNKSISSIHSEQVSLPTNEGTRISFNLNEESDKSQISSYLRNNSLFSIYNGGLERSNHLIKHSAPRLSDGHIHYRIKMAVKNDLKQQNGQLINNQIKTNQNFNSKSNDGKSRNQVPSFVIETEV